MDVHIVWVGVRSSTDLNQVVKSWISGEDRSRSFMKFLMANGSERWVNPDRVEEVEFSPAYTLDTEDGEGVGNA